ncbi:MAG: hypothetical protein E7299_03610 [Lachnospiraceae bacterium]|nr:hypothetical protein [Lachnospiraceae bacterium]
MRKQVGKNVRRWETKQKKHDLKTKLFFGGIFGFATIATILAILFFVPKNDDTEEGHRIVNEIKKKAKVTHPVEKGLEKLLEELEESEKALLTGEGIEKRINRLTAGNVDVDYTLNISNVPELDGKTIGADGVFQRNVTDKKMYLHTDISISRIKMLLADVYGYHDELAVCLPEVTETDSILLNTEHIDKQFNESKLSQYLDVKIPMELSLYPYETYNVAIPDEVWLQTMLLDIFEDKEIDEVDKADKEETITVEESVLELRTYLVTFEDERSREKESGKQDKDESSTFEIALDKNKNVRILRFPEEFEYGNIITEEAELQFLGEEEITDQVNVDAKVLLGNKEIIDQEIGREETQDSDEVQIILDAEITEDLSVYMNIIQGKKELAVSADIRGIKEETTEIDINYLTIKENDTNVIKVTGLVNMRELTEQIPENTGEVLDVLHMDEMDLLMTLMPWSRNIEKRYGGMLDAL